MDNTLAIKIIGFIIFLIIGMIIYFIPFTQNENTSAAILATSLVLVIISEIFIYKKYIKNWITTFENRPIQPIQPRERPAVTSIIPVVDLADINPVVVRKFTI